MAISFWLNTGLKEWMHLLNFQLFSQIFVIKGPRIQGFKGSRVADSHGLIAVSEHPNFLTYKKWIFLPPTKRIKY